MVRLSSIPESGRPDSVLMIFSLDMGVWSTMGASRKYFCLDTTEEPWEHTKDMSYNIATFTIRITLHDHLLHTQHARLSKAYPRKILILHLVSTFDNNFWSLPQGLQRLSSMTHLTCSFSNAHWYHEDARPENHYIQSIASIRSNLSQNKLGRAKALNITLLMSTSTWSLQSTILCFKSNGSRKIMMHTKFLNNNHEMMHY